MFRQRILFSAAAGLAAIVATAGIAFAAWSAHGTGTAAGGAAVANNLVITAISPSGAAANLYPGGPAGWVYYTPTNPNPYAVVITGYQWGTPVSTNPTACPSSNITLDASAPTTDNFVVPANTPTGALAHQVFNVLDLSHSAPDGCQGVTFVVPLTITGSQQ